MKKQLSQWVRGLVSFLKGAGMMSTAISTNGTIWLEPDSRKEPEIFYVGTYHEQDRYRPLHRCIYVTFLYAGVFLFLYTLFNQDKRCCATGVTKTSPSESLEMQIIAVGGERDPAA